MQELSSISSYCMAIHATTYMYIVTWDMHSPELRPCMCDGNNKINFLSPVTLSYTSKDQLAMARKLQLT